MIVPDDEKYLSWIFKKILQCIKNFQLNRVVNWIFDTKCHVAKRRQLTTSQALFTCPFCWTRWDIMSGRHLQVVVPFLNARLANRGLTALVSRHKTVVGLNILSQGLPVPRYHSKIFILDHFWPHQWIPHPNIGLDAPQPVISSKQAFSEGC